MIPNYQSLMLPLLRLAEDEQEHRIGDAIDQLTQQLGLTQEDLAEMTPSIACPAMWRSLPRQWTAALSLSRCTIRTPIS
jgi:restriction endonuclease Mrr